MQKLITKKYSPSDKLLAFINTYWSVKNSSSENIDLPVVPDGCMDIIYKVNQQKREISVAGAMDEAIVVPIAPDEYYFGIRFRPSILSFLLNQNMSHFSNKIILMLDISNKMYHKLDFNEDDESLKIKNLNRIFEEEFKNITINKHLIFCINLITKKQGDISVEEVVKKSNLNIKQLERLFLYHLGYSPKKFIRVMRFFYTHKSIVENGTHSLSQTAYNAGYCDQSHFNKEYKKFTHFSPKDKNMSILYNTKYMKLL